MTKTVSRLKRIIPLVMVVAVSIVYIACNDKRPAIEYSVNDKTIAKISRDLDEIKESGVLRLITRNNSNCYFFIRGGQFGFEFELAKRYADHIGVKLEVITPSGCDEMIPNLEEGKGDIIGANFMQTKERRRYVNFAEPWFLEDLVVVTHKSKDIIEDPVQLIGQKIYLRKHSPAVNVLGYWRRMLKDNFLIEYVSEEMEDEDILQEVSSGQYDVTIVGRHVAELESTHTPHLGIGLPLSENIPVGWAIRKNSPNLQESINQFILNLKKKKLFKILKHKYYYDTNRLRRQRRHSTYTLESGNLSAYDTVIKSVAKKYDIDWRFVAAVIYHESSFNPKIESWAGAKGLMQLMPNTAKTLRLDCFSSDRANINCGVKLLNNLSKLFNYIDKKDRLPFVLASYNAGLGHTRDAQHLAIDTGHNPLVWRGHISEMMNRLSLRKWYKKARHGYCNGPSINTYVDDILSLYSTYSQILPLDNSPDVIEKPQQKSLEMAAGQQLPDELSPNP